MVSLIKKYLFHNFIYNISLRNRLLIYFLLVVLIPLSIISVMLYKSAENLIEDKINTVMVNNLDASTESFKRELLYLNDICVSFNLNPTIKEILNYNEDVTDQQVAIDQINELEKQLDGYFHKELTKVYDGVIAPKIYILHRSAYKKFSFSKRVFNLDKDNIESLFGIKDKDAPFFLKGPIFINENENSPSIIRYSQRLYNLGSVVDLKEYKAVISVDIQAFYYADILKKLKPSEGTEIILINGDNVIVASTSMTGVGETVSKRTGIDTSRLSEINEGTVVKLQNAKNKFLVSTKSLNIQGWKVLFLTPEAEFSLAYMNFNKKTAVVVVICLVLALTAALTLASDIASPITKLIRSMNQAAKGDFNISLNYNRKDEYSYLIERYKSMLEQIKGLIDRLYISEMEKHKAELAAKSAELESLQSKINPHFLYNTLNSIYGMAKYQENEDIAVMVKSLSDFFRYNLSKGKTIITIEDELKHLESYLTILKFRMGDRLVYSIDVPKELLEYSIVKLVLQPLVENSIKHGFEDMAEGGEVLIRGTLSNGVISLSVIDNGVGADVEELNQMLYKNNGKAYGIINVHQRLQHAYGDGYGLRFTENQSKSGLSAIVRLPAVIVNEVENA
ncbi:MAG: histidine kinase [Clostridiaceae bacterium]|nr:histidine kinase [Clostridiaceae bacterium]